MKNELCIAEEDESILASIDESFTDDDSNGGSISTNSLEYIWYRSYVHIDMNARDSRLKICNSIK